MSAGTQRFHKVEVSRALRAAIDAGITNPRVEIDPHTGKIVIMAGAPIAAASAPAANEWDAVA